ncbi:TlpA family protein disulfide reductase [Mangrovimonas spongiae]|uniref:TlpA family protein disulfide reductase n=1 Tax=Mangrovimonas spongiae TaxID=2494697 RepID=A0A428JWR0_9FLAO|nr:redoxin family protein [Mangrovimonas spongiae]RSK38560.1 TlpA family protein disulfide reductase [Mangrovimonas spongiae]
MKRLPLLLLALAAVSCNKVEEKPKDYVSFSGTITNKNSDSLVVRSRTYSKTIAVNEDGTFSDTLKLDTGIYNLFDGAESTDIFLKNGFDISMTIDTKMFDETVKYTGEGAEHSNFLAQKSLKEEDLLNIDELSKLEDSTALVNELNTIKSELTTFYKSNTKIDSTITENALKNVEPMLKSYQGYLLSKITLKKELPKGSPSPVFENYENHAGGTTSLSDLKGKYVYIDVWATWCGPCKAEIPYLKEVEKKYHDKNIEFVSISIDDAKRSGGGSMEKAKEKWSNMVEEKELGGIQLISDKNWQSEFVQNYKINGIPRFILIDPDGNIVSPDAPRPSSDALIKLFNELNI